MAHTLFIQSSRNPQCPVPTNSPSFRVPDVLLVGPEEEDDGPWLLFDAAKDSERDLSKTPDLEFLDVALNAIHNSQLSSPVFHRGSLGETGEDVVMPRRGDYWPRKISIRDEEERLETQHFSGEDSVVVEVVKVRRGEGYQGKLEGKLHTSKRSTGFRTAASKAFQSIKNVAKGSSRKPPAQDVWSLDGKGGSHNEREEEPPRDSSEQRRPRAPTLSRRSSSRISQLFSSPNKTHNISSVESEHALISSAFQSEISLHSFPVQRSSMPIISHADTHPSLELPMDDDPQLSVRPVSPTSSTKSSLRRRFSILELGGLFSSSSSKPPSYLSSSLSKSLSSAPVMFRDPSTNSSAPSTSTEASSDTPDTPEDVCLINPLPCPNSKLGEEAGDPDLASEMRLDSLHFDSLSFDPDEF
jgi:hypothetical protein